MGTLLGQDRFHVSYGDEGVGLLKIEGTAFLTMNRAKTDEARSKPVVTFKLDGSRLPRPVGFSASGRLTVGVV